PAQAGATPADGAKTDAAAPADPTKTDAAKADATAPAAPADPTAAGAPAAPAQADDGTQPDVKDEGLVSDVAKPEAGAKPVDTGPSQVQVSPAAAKAVDGSPAAQTDGGGDGNHAARGAPTPMDLGSLKDISKLIKDAMDNAKPLAKALTGGTLDASSIQKLVDMVKKVAPNADVAKLTQAFQSASGILTQVKDAGALAQEIMKGGLTPESVDKLLGIAQSVVPGLDAAKLKAQIAGAVDWAVNEKASLDKLVDQIQKGVLPGGTIDKILELAKKAVPGLDTSTFTNFINKAAQLYKNNGGKIDEVLGTLKGWFGKTDEEAKKDDKKDDGKKDDGTAEDAAEDAAEGEKASDHLDCGKEWRPIENHKFGPVIPYVEYKVKEGDTLDSLAKTAGVDAKTFLKETFGSGVSNRKRLKTRNTPMKDDVVVLPKKGSACVKIVGHINGYKEGTTVNIEIYRQYRETPDQVIEKLTGQSDKHGRVEANWNYTYDKKKHGEKPQFIYKMKVKGGGKTANFLQTSGS
ncbi:MAG TPA: hypothetical protein VHF22_06530, partial [Planctomycetota bacterium]|nr:hypothetical protein [Planctomycetota bacterium]